MEARVHHKHKRSGSQKNGLLLVLRDIALLIVVMNVFALFHHVLPHKLTPVGISSAHAAEESTADAPQTTSMAADFAAASGGSASPDAASGETLPPASPGPSPTPSMGDFSATFPAADTGAGALYSYQTDTVRIAVNRVQENGVTYFLADIYIKNIDALKTAFAKDTYGKNIYTFPTKTAQNNGAVLAVTGDYYSARSKGIVVRNGALYRDVPSSDTCVLFRSGKMKTYTGETPDLSDFESQNIWQTWSFGPALLTADGGAISAFSSDLTDRHPRCGIGYYAPGHYCLIVVDGRKKGYSVGLRLSEFSALFESLGCRQAYNLDGGATAIMMWNGEVINEPYKGGRESGDIIYLS